MINISIGMFDKDLKTFKNSPFNLELMKLSTYFKDRGEIVTLVPTFSPEKHQKFYYWQDYFTDNITEKITQPNVTIGGRAFTNDVYKPLKEEVERQKPDVFLYSKTPYHIVELIKDINEDGTIEIQKERFEIEEGGD